MREQKVISLLFFFAEIRNLSNKMKTNIKRNKSQFVAVASIATELSDVMVVAKEISLAAANAKAIAYRAGEKARGFQPITDFINELARETIGLVNQINEQASELYETTVSEHRHEQANRQFKRVLELGSDAAHVGSLRPVIERSEDELEEKRYQFKSQVDHLLDQLSEIMHPARAARVIAANSRIEASQAGEFLQSLLTVAESVDKAAELMYTNVQRCRSSMAMMEL
jgi:methyl-accepting chemotaxis protein